MEPPEIFDAVVAVVALDAELTVSVDGFVHVGAPVPPDVSKYPDVPAVDIAIADAVE